MNLKKTFLLTSMLLLCFCLRCFPQSIIDPCFVSIEKLGRYIGSNDLQNTCLQCPTIENAADLVEWNGVEWLGKLEDSRIDLPPPFGCNVRAMWLGSKEWTYNGEAFALRLDRPLQAGMTYSYRFTYASNGIHSHGNFSPIIYTNNSSEIRQAFKVGRLPETDIWNTESFSFTAQPQQTGHNWIILHAIESSGFILSDCILENPLKYGFDLEINDTTICAGDSIKLQLPPGNFHYEWSTGENSNYIFASQEGQYTVEIRYHLCFTRDTLNLYLKDCSTWIKMPNYFSPNGDNFNQTFLPEEYNFITYGELHVFNRWGNLIFKGDLFKGWDGNIDGEEASSGIYFYLITFLNKNGKYFHQKGIVTLSR